MKTLWFRGRDRNREDTRKKIQEGGKSKGQGLRKVKRDSKKEKRNQVEEKGGGKTGCECKRRCFGRGRRPPLCLRGVGGGGASCGVCFSSRSTRYVIVRVAKGVLQDPKAGSTGAVKRRKREGVEVARTEFRREEEEEVGNPRSLGGGREKRL